RTVEARRAVEESRLEADLIAGELFLGVGQYGRVHGPGARCRPAAPFGAPIDAAVYQDVADRLVVELDLPGGNTEVLGRARSVGGRITQRLRTDHAGVVVLVGLVVGCIARTQDAGEVLAEVILDLGEDRRRAGVERQVGDAVAIGNAVDEGRQVRVF